MSTYTPPIAQATFVGLNDDDRATVLRLVAQINSKRRRNEVRRAYYDGHNRLKDLGISIPPTLKDVEVVVGWPAKAVDSMSRRTVLEGFASPDQGSELSALIEDLWDSNRLASEIPAANTSALIHSCAFGFVHLGDAAAGEPQVLVTVRSAEDATGTWDRRRRALRDALSVVEVDPASGQPVLMNLYLPGRVVTLRRVRDGLYDTTEVTHGADVPVELLPYRADLSRPFGRSRITRGVMYNTDAAVRTLLRTEVGAEFYNAPQRYALGADEDAFEDKDGKPVPAWTVMLGRLLTLSRDEDGNLPTVGQFAQQSMQPNIEQLRSIAQMFASETSLDVGSLGIVQDNPDSAEAIRARKEELGIEIEHWQRTALAPAWQRLMARAVAMSTGSDAAAAEARRLRAVWGSWSTPSEVSQAQAALARVQAVPRLAETDVELERMGYSADQIARIQAQWARSSSRSNIAALAAQALDAADEAPAVIDEAADIKAKADAMGVLIRAGVESGAAAERVGLSGITFTGAVPVSLRLPTTEAAALEDA